MCLFGILSVPAWAQQDPLPLPAPAGAELVDQGSEDFATYPLIVDSIDQRGGIKGNISSTRTVEGELSRRTYRLGDARGAEAVAAAYAQRLSDAGFEPLFECTGEACGPMFTRAAPGYRNSAELFNVSPAGQFYRAARKGGAGGDVYVAVQVAQATGDAPVFVQVDTLKVEPRVIGAITVNATEMARQLETSGRVALYGLFFATDSAEIKPESRATLGEIAKLLEQKPSLRLLVVGHTDSRGSFEYNLDLSRRRANAVVDALVNEYGVSPERLKPWGVGFTAPRESNASAVGRTRNRRVELVVW